MMAFASKGEKEFEHLTVAVEVRADLIKDIVMFKNYVLPAVDQKIIEIVGEYFQINPRERLYLEPGTIAKTSSGKIRHQHNRQRFLQHNFEGLIERVFSSQDDKSSVDAETKHSLESEIAVLF